MKTIISENFESSREEILDLVEHFEEKGELLGPGKRNKIKLFELQGIIVNIKAFKTPNIVNRVVYRYFRKSKAQRSYTYAHKLLQKEIGTPRPIAFLEERSSMAFRKSYYISEHLTTDLTYRDLVENSNYPNHEEILRAFTRFTYKLHERGVEFLDHSPGNTLIRLNNGDYQFFLVDLNRMNFKNLSLEARMKNFSRLTPRKEMVRVMASEYARLISQPEEVIFQKMWGYTREFQKEFQRKKVLKKKIKFWRK